MHEKAKFICFNYMQPQKVKIKSIQINTKHVSYCVIVVINKHNKLKLKRSQNDVRLRRFESS